MNKERFLAANFMALVTHGLTQPLDLIKVRAQVLQEGKTFTGLGFQKGFSPGAMFNEIHSSGGGYRKFYTSFDGFVAKTVAYTTARVWGFLMFYDWLNPDPRRTARPDWFIMAGLGGGFLAGVVTNPIDLVFTRMQVDELYPEACRRNYKNVLDGLIRATDEGVLLRGAVANGLKVGAICASMTNVYDWCKENSYYWFGPSWINRTWATGAAVACGVAAAMPFDAVAVRMHTMRPLPDGRYPYETSIDCLFKMFTYEGNPHHQGNFGCYFSGGQAMFIRLYLIAFISQHLLDYYHGRSSVSEFWQPARFNYQGGIDYDVHEPFTDAFNKMMMSRFYLEGQSEAAFSPDNKTTLTTI